MYLYPRLPLSLATALAASHSKLSFEDLRSPSISPIKYPGSWYAPTGGNRVETQHLEIIQVKVRACANDFNYPKAPNTAGGRGFDSSVAKILHEQMQISPAEASNITMWSYMTCVLLPDIVRWRFPGDNGTTPVERFVGSSRGLRRNTFGRLWWRAYLLYDPNTEDPYNLLTQFTEDELVQITERPSLAGNVQLVKTIYRIFLEASSQYPSLPRRDIFRDAAKRVRRLLPVMVFDLLDEETLHLVIDDIFQKAANSVSATSSL